MSGPVVKDGAALREYLVRLALQAIEAAVVAVDAADEADARAITEKAVRERMAQAAQCIVCEVAEIERVNAERLAEVRAAVRHHQDVAHLWHEEVSDAATFAERMETLVAADARLSAAIADGGES